MRSQWDNAVLWLGGRSTPAADDLVRRYAEPHRKYHNAIHVEAVLRDARELSDEDNPVLVLAICAHDVVYDAQPGADERASAAWARLRLTEAGLAEDHVAQVESLVLATITHQSDDPLARILLDADLAILAAAPDAYDLYSRYVREEYASYADDVWRHGRTQVLRSLLDRDDLYQTPRARALWDAQARANLQRELIQLG
jgi:predicted metal-dependent HD superfamily phosphohydrolase